MKSNEPKNRSRIPLAKVVSNFPSDFENKLNFPSGEPIRQLPILRKSRE